MTRRKALTDQVPTKAVEVPNGIVVKVSSAQILQLCGDVQVLNQKVDVLVLGQSAMTAAITALGGCNDSVDDASKVRDATITLELEKFRGEHAVDMADLRGEVKRNSRITMAISGTLGAIAAWIGSITHIHIP